MVDDGRGGRIADSTAVLLLATAAAAFAWGVFWQRAEAGATFPNHDYYSYFYPNLTYALQALQRGHGLLWNSLQNCGQPFFGNSQSGLLYPPHAVFLLFGPDRGQFVQIALHLAVGGAGAYWLCRELRCGPAGALAGGAAFLLGGITVFLASWMPIIIAPYAWMPAALAAAERALRRPTLGAAVLLGVLLTIQLLPGYPQINFFTYLAIGVRLAWELATHRAARRLRTVAAVGLGLALPAGLAAAQYLPALEFARESLRSGQLTLAEIRPPGQAIDWGEFRAALGARTPYGNVLMLLPVGLAGLALAAPAQRRVAWSYALLVGLAFAIAFDTPVFELFRRLPFGSSFRLPHRFLWLAAFAAAVLAGLGVDAAARGGEQPGAPRRRAGLLAAFATAVAGFAVLSPFRLYPSEAALAGLALAALVALLFVPRLRLPALCALPLLVAAGGLLFARAPLSGPLRDGRVLQTRRAAFEWVRARLQPHERVYQIGRPGDLSLSPKTASLFGVRSITDYETQTSRRFASLHTRLFLGRPLRSINEYYYKVQRQPLNRPLFDLLATRYVIADAAADVLPATSLPPLREVARFADTVVYENPTALPRAFWVPAATVLTDPEQAFAWLDSGFNDPRRWAILESRPADGFFGDPRSTGESSVAIVADGGETLSLRVVTPAEGFLVLTDQYYPGWEAEVNGLPVEVQRANGAFRAVRVPKGAAAVTFRYRPASLRIGLWVSAVTWTLVIVYAVGKGLRRLRRRPAAALPPATMSAPA